MQFALVALLTLAEASSPFFTKAKPFSQEFEDNYNVLKHTGWQGPWSQRRGVGLNRDPPAGCRVDQVAMLHRHGERYPSASDAQSQAYVHGNMTSGRTEPFVGSLEFLNWWIPFADGHTAMDAQESLYSPYSGLLGALSNGVDYRRRYGHLYDGESILPIFTSGYERVAMTARKFGEGFFGFNYTDLCAMQIIPEALGQGANTLVTGDCPAAIEHVTSCPVPSEEYLDSYTSGWFLPEFTQAAKRLNRENNLNLTGEDVHNLMATAAFELNIRGNSPWIQVFTDEEWVAFEYYESAYYYCYFGPKSEAAPYRGSVYLNATRTLLNQGPEEVLPLYFSFAHDTDITPVVALLGFASPDSYDPSQVTFGSSWDVTDIVPQNAHLVFERLICEDTADLSAEQYSQSTIANMYPMAFNNTNGTATYANNYTYPMGVNETVPRYFGNLTSNSTHSNSSIADSYEYTTGTNENIYIRIVLNEAVVPLPNCSSGPGKSCKLSDFNKLVDAAIEGKDYFANCVEPLYPDAPKHVDFFWNWNLTNENDLNPDPVPYQIGLIDYEGGISNASPY